jgi:hypothetical protein
MPLFCVSDYIISLTLISITGTVWCALASVFTLGLCAVAHQSAPRRGEQVKK